MVAKVATNSKPSRSFIWVSPRVDEDAEFRGRGGRQLYAFVTVECVVFRLPLPMEPQCARHFLLARLAYRPAPRRCLSTTNAKAFATKIKVRFMAWAHPADERPPTAPYPMRTLLPADRAAAYLAAHAGKPDPCNKRGMSSPLRGDKP